MESNVLKVLNDSTSKDTHIILSGEIDIYTSEHLKDEVNEVVSACQGDLFIDCLELSYIDSTGLGILVGALKEIRKKNKNIYISNLKENIRKLFIITGLDKLFIIKE